MKKHLTLLTIIILLILANLFVIYVYNTKNKNLMTKNTVVTTQTNNTEKVENGNNENDNKMENKNIESVEGVENPSLIDKSISKDNKIHGKEILIKKDQTLKNESNNFIVDIEIEGLNCVSGTELVKCDDDIKKYLEQKTKDTYQEFLTGREIDLSNTKKMIENMGVGFGYTSESMLYISRKGNEDHYSFVIKGNYYLGGAHGHEFMITKNYKSKSDMLTNKNQIENLSEIYGPDIYKKLSGKLEKEVTADTQQEIQFKDGIAPEEKNYKTWYIKDNKLNVYIWQYQIMSYAFGSYLLKYEQD